MKVSLLLGIFLFASVSANAQVETINENFQSFTTGFSAAWPQNGWSKAFPSGSGPFIYADGTDNKYIQFYSSMSPNTPGYLITPQIVAPDGTKSLTFTYALTTGSAGNGTLEVGLVPSLTNEGVVTFTSISPVYTVDSSTGTGQTVTISVPASTNQYIAFRFTGAANHAALKIDDVLYNTSGNLSVSNTFQNKKDDVKFFINSENTALQFVSKKDPKNINIYSTNGQKVAEGKVNNTQSFDISSLQTGVYLTLIETAEGPLVKSKFIKR